MTGAAAFARHVADCFDRLKAGPFGAGAMRFEAGAHPALTLLPVTADCAADPRHVARMAAWRRDSIEAFPKIFTVTEAGTARWAKSALIDRKDRMLFYAAPGTVPGDDSLLGHVGLSSFDFGDRRCEIDNIVRGAPGTPGLMAGAIAHMMDWAYGTLGIAEIRLRVLHDNTRAIALYHRLGFVPCGLEPLREVVPEEGREWVPSGPDGPIDRFYLVMRHEREGTDARG